MNSQTYGIRPHNCQVVLVTMQGSIYESCDSIFLTEQYLGKPLKELCYFFEGELDSILNSTATKITFEKIRIESKYLPGYYDFIFSKQALDGQQFLLWEIYDYTIVYKEYAFLQQLQNEIAIQDQLVKKNLSTAKDNLEFFQSGYTSSEESNVKKLIKKTINSKFSSSSKLFRKPSEPDANMSLVNLKNCADGLVNEINYFVKQLKNTQYGEIDIKPLIRSLLNSHSINFAADVPDKVYIDENLVKKLLQILSIQYAPLPSSSAKDIDVTFTKSLSKGLYLSIIIKENAKFVMSLACNFIKLSVLKSLVAMISGDLTLDLQENESIFVTIIDIPTK